MNAQRRFGFWMRATALVVAAAACAGKAAGRPANTDSDIGEVHLSVKNEFGFPVTVVAIGSGVNWSMGKVMPAAVRESKVPEALVVGGAVEFVVTGDGPEPFRSGPMLLTSARLVEIIVKRPLSASTAVVRR
jgi:hypothetical protein